jgi:predicted nucleic acid-binding protein
MPVVLPTDDGVLSRAKGLHLVRRAFWDALILAACVEVGVDVLYSEDLPGFHDFEGVRIINPFQ